MSSAKRIFAEAPSAADLAKLDQEDALAWTRGEFEIPNARACGGEVDEDAIYFCGNSLGLLNKKARKHMIEELDVWGSSSVTGHFNHPHDRPWKHVDRPMTPHLAKLVGASEDEVAHTSTLTSNIHVLLTSFYKPTPKRWKIVIEQGSFPSDWYAIHSHPALHDAVLSKEQIDDAIIALKPREGEEVFRTEDILQVLADNADEIAVVWLPLVQYYTGQLFDVAPISKKSHEIGALIGLDMAHGVGNVKVELNKWDIDFAVWCTYKYLNAGPAAIGGMYVKTGLDDGGKRLTGWWGNDAATRFQMSPQFRPTPGAKGYQHSCTPVFSSIPLLATLELMDKAGFDKMLEKQKLLTGALESLLQSSRFYRPSSTANAVGDAEPESDSEVGFRIITPAYPFRGTQLSLLILPRKTEDGAGKGIMPRIFNRMLKKGLVGDEREPSVIRLSPVVLYNTFAEVGKAVKIIEESLEEEVELERQNGSSRDAEIGSANVDMTTKG